MSTRSAESRDNSPDGSSEKRASKKRKVLSCFACRNRKMKCDRVYPVCGRCQRTGRADQCTYDPRLLEDFSVHRDGHVETTDAATFIPDNANRFPLPTHAQGDALTWKIRLQERRLEAVERRLTEADSSHSGFRVLPYRPDCSNVEVDEPTIKEEMMFRGKGFKTQFYGSTSPFSVISQFGELQTFTRGALSRDMSMTRIRTDFKTFRNRRKAYVEEKGLKSQGSDAELFTLIPEKILVDAAVALYFQRFEDAYRILHEPSFWKEYGVFWDQTNNDEKSSSFAATLILITAITSCILPQPETLFIGDSSADRELASDMIQACDAWLLRHSRKHLTLAFFQLQCLSILAKRINCVKMKQDWVHSGDTMRLAIAAGLHRNPGLLGSGKISEYENEMRRRIWATIMELELQCSIDTGLQSSLCGFYFDAQPPCNIPDDGFSPESRQIPAARPIEHFTHASYLTISLQSLSLRVHLMQLLSNPTTDLQYADVLHYDNQLTSLLSSLPKWEDPRAAVSLTLLDLQLRQFLLILHRPYAKLASSNPRFSYSLTACVNAGNAIISLHEGLLSKGILALNHCRNDILRTVITFAQVVYHNSTLSTEQPNGTQIGSANGTAAPPLQPADSGGLPDVRTDMVSASAALQIPHLPKNDFMVSTLCSSAIELMERGRSVFEHKVMRLGTGYMEYWLVCAAVGIMPSMPLTPTTTSRAINTGPDDIQSRERKAIDRITSLCFRVLAMQKDPGSDFAYSLRNTIATASTPDMPSSVSTVGVTPLGSSTIPSLEPYLQGAEGLARALDENAKSGMGMQGQWDGLQDMQVDLGGWNFPDFWAFDVGGDF